MTTLRDRINSVEDASIKKAWPFYAHAFNQFLMDYPSSPQFIAGKSNEEIGIAMKVITDLREKISQASAPQPVPAQPKVKKLSSITRQPTA